MMKKVMLALLSLFVVREIQAQDFVVTQERRARPKPQVVFVTPRVDGAVPRGFRLGNPLQMLNPFAPRSYGDGQEFIYYNETDPFQPAGGRRMQPHGLRLFAFEW